MEIYLKPIISACYVFPVLAVLFTLPYIIYEYHKYGSILVIRTGVVYTFIFYMLTSYFMTVLPLPPIDSVTPDSACMLLVPFDAVRRVVATVNITLSNPATYINLFKCGDFWQIAFNILLLVPFGVYLRYYFKRKWWQVLIMSFCYSLFFELTQLSGLYGIYPYPYRFFEVDDLICNTLGGMVGFWVMPPVFLQKEPEEKLIQISSARTDALIAGVYHLSRTESNELFREQKVFINGRLCENNSRALKEGDQITVRGYGKFAYEGEKGISRKGKVNVRVLLW